jgi:hypothetical protein
VIRFSAALVAVAIGVLIGGIATSKLLLVYIAIVVSAVALLVLAIGVVLKREELFGDGQRLVHAGADPAVVWPDHAGDSQVPSRQDASVPPSAPFPGPAAAYGAAFESPAGAGAAATGSAFAGAAQAVPPTTVPPTTVPPSAESSASYRPLAGQGRAQAADPVLPWEAQSARDQWSSSPWQGGPVAGGPVVGGPVAGGTVTDNPVTDGAPDWMSGGRGAPGPAVQAGGSAPSTPAAPPGAGPGPASAERAPLSWFDPRPKSAESAESVDAGPQVSAVPAAGDPTPDPDAASADEDDDWPTRYSWLDDEPDESSDENETPVSPAVDTDNEAGGTDLQAGDPDATRDHPVPAVSTRASLGHDSAKDGTADDAAGTDAVSAPPTVGRPAFDPAPPVGTASALNSEPPTVGRPAFTPAEDTHPEPEPLLTDGEPPSADSPDATEAEGLVSVLHGVPRYHRPDCVLIRFMPEDDIKRLPAAQAKADGCTPCAACQPAE